MRKGHRSVRAFEETYKLLQLDTTVYYRNILRFGKKAAMAVGERRNYQYQEANLLPFVAALSVMQPMSKAQHGSNVDEQKVPQGYPEPRPDSYQENWQNDLQNGPLIPYGQWYNGSYPLNHNVVAYPTLQPGMNDATPVQGTSDERATLLSRQVSIPLSNGSLDQYLNNSDFEYDQALDSVDFAGYGGVENFSLEDYADLEKVNFSENDGISFDVTIKQEKPEGCEARNLEEMESVLNNTMLNTNNNSEWTVYNYPDNIIAAPVSGNDQSLDELDNMNFSEFLDGIYQSPHSREWQSQGEDHATSNQPSTVSEQLIIKSEPDESSQSNCSIILQQNMNNTHHIVPTCLPVSDEELIEMPVSRFNELLISLTEDQSNFAKDIRRRGKNKKAARLCRKRKLDNISALEQGIIKMEDDKNRLLEERKQIVSETEELKRKIDSICEILINGLTAENVNTSSDFSVLHHSKGNTLLVRK